MLDGMCRKPCKERPFRYVTICSKRPVQYSFALREKAAVVAIFANKNSNPLQAGKHGVHGIENRFKQMGTGRFEQGSQIEEMFSSSRS